MRGLILIASLFAAPLAQANTGFFNCYKDCVFLVNGGPASAPVKSFDFTATLTPDVLAIRAGVNNTTVAFNFRRHGNILYTDNGYRMGSVTANGSFKVDLGTALQCSLTVSGDATSPERLATTDCHDSTGVIFKGDLVMVGHTQN